jgi:NAD(P)-dependent dehydrogenase (short-subunit alcohol dehydrogenase family)
METRTLVGKNAVITGASRGLGFSIAEALAKAEARVALVARDSQRLKAAAEQLRSRDLAVEPLVADVKRETEVRAMADAVASRFGKLQILVNNAGINLRQPLAEFTLAEWREVLDTNLTGAFLVTRALLPHMRGQGYGRIINLTSMMSHVALPQRTAYCASKFGLLGLTRALALELAPEQITVNGISPGPFATEINRPLLDSAELSQWFVSRIPLGRWGEPREVGQLALYLCSEEAGFITGADIVIDGGWTAQ